MDGKKGTLDSLASDGFYGDVVVGGSVVALEDLAVLTGADLAAQHVVVNQLRHKYKTNPGYLSLDLEWRMDERMAL